VGNKYVKTGNLIPDSSAASRLRKVFGCFMKYIKPRLSAEVLTNLDAVEPPKSDAQGYSSWQSKLTAAALVAQTEMELYLAAREEKQKQDENKDNKEKTKGGREVGLFGPTIMSLNTRIEALGGYEVVSTKNRIAGPQDGEYLKLALTREQEAKLLPARKGSTSSSSSTTTTTSSNE
jgi:hypothetical protein